MGFPFYPKRKSLLPLSKVYKKTNYSDSDRKFLDYVRFELGDDPKRQTKVFYTNDLLDKDSRHFCGIGGLAVEARRKELGLEDNSEYPMWRLHPNRVFSTECPKCSVMILIVFQKRTKVDGISNFNLFVFLSTFFSYC